MDWITIIQVLFDFKDKRVFLDFFMSHWQKWTDFGPYCKQNLTLNSFFHSCEIRSCTETRKGQNFGCHAKFPDENSRVQSDGWAQRRRQDHWLYRPSPLRYMWLHQKENGAFSAKSKGQPQIYFLQWHGKSTPQMALVQNWPQTKALKISWKVNALQGVVGCTLPTSASIRKVRSTKIFCNMTFFMFTFQR